MSARWAHCGFCGGPMLVGIDGRCVACERKIADPVAVSGTNAYPPPSRCRECGGPLGAFGPMERGVQKVRCARCGVAYDLAEPDPGDIVLADDDEPDDPKTPQSAEDWAEAEAWARGETPFVERFVDLVDDERHDMWGSCGIGTRAEMEEDGFGW
jgi:hypothetical protein